MPLGEHVLHVSALGYATREGVPVRLGTPGEHHASIVLHPVPSGRLEIRVEAHPGSRLPERPRVGFYGVSPGTEDVSRREPLGRSNSHVWPRVPAGRYVVEVLDTWDRRLHREEIEVVEGANQIQIAVPAPDASGTLTGRLLRPDGGSARFAQLSFHGLAGSFWRTAYSDGTGRWRAELPPGTYDVEIEHPDLAHRRVSGIHVTPGDREVDPWRLAHGMRLRGRIEGVSAAELSLVRVSAFTQETSVEGFVEPTGDFQIDRLAPGEWTLQAVLVNSPRRTQTRVTLTVESPPEGALLRFEPAFLVSGRITDRGLPLAGATVSLDPVQHDTTHGGFTTTDLTGAFELQGVPPGDYYLMVSVSPVGRIHMRGVRLPAPGRTP